MRCSLIVAFLMKNCVQESCGIADLIASCIGGRNRLVAKAFAERMMRGDAVSFESLEVGRRFLRLMALPEIRITQIRRRMYVHTGAGRIASGPETSGNDNFQ